MIILSENEDLEPEISDKTRRKYLLHTRKPHHSSSDEKRGLRGQGPDEFASPRGANRSEPADQRKNMDEERSTICTTFSIAHNY
jgi:hypothetical protein